MKDDFEDWLTARAPETDADDGRLLPGTVIGGYRIEALLGKGGFAEVYRAKGEDGSAAAIKILHRLDEKSRLRFERESRILAQIRHANLPRFLGFGTCGERPYIVTELLFAYELPQTDASVARFLRAMMSVVEELHACGFVHRDIKPANILGRANGEPVLIDFGLATPVSAQSRTCAALSVEGDVQVAVGTPGFSAPEQFSGMVSGPASDIHALGALIGACFGERMPRAWRRIYLTATNSNPDVRYQTVSALRRAVSCRHLWRSLFIAAGVTLVTALAFMLMDVIGDYRAENRIPHHFQER